MPRRLLTVALAVLMTISIVSPALGLSSALVQNVDTSAYPKLVLTVVVSPDAVTAPGEVPDISVTENGQHMGDVAVSPLQKERGPIDVVLLMDASGSMKGQPLDDAKVAARRFVESMESADRIAIVSFSSEPAVVQDFTSDRRALYAAIDALQAAGETALYDGLVQASGALSASTASARYIVALSDGGDTMSLNPPDNASRAVAEAQAPVYAVALQSPEYNPATLDSIARASGGRMTTVSESGSLADVYQAIAEEMQLRYKVEYVSGRPNTPELDLTVTVGSGQGAVTTGVTVRNPRFEASAGNVFPLKPARPSTVALLASLAAAFCATALGALAVAHILRKDHAALDQLKFYDQLHQSAGSDSLQFDDGTVRTGVLNALGGIAERHGFTGMVQTWLESAGVALRANEYIFFHVLGTIVVGFVVQILSGGSMVWAALAVLLAVVMPLLYLRMKTASRLHKFNDQLPDILDLIAGSLRSGWGVQQSIDLVVSEVGEPASSEFRRTQAESRLGLPLEEALQRMAVRVASEDLTWVVSAISIQREVGGNLAEVLNTVSRTIRERSELHRQVSALTAEGRFSLVVLAILPFFVFAGLFVVNPQYMMLAVKTPLGLGAFALGGLLLLVGITWLNSVLKIEV